MREVEYDFMLHKWGEPTGQQPMPPEVIEQYVGILPEGVLKFWREYGCLQFMDGLHWTVNPNDWQPVVDAWLKDTVFASMGTYYALSRDAFGGIRIWNPKVGGGVSITACLHQVSASSFEVDDFIGLEITANHCLYGSDPKGADIENNGKPIYKRAVKTYGKLGWDEMYAFEPSVALGGHLQFDHVARVRWLPHLMMIRDLVPPKVPYTDVNDVLSKAGLKQIWDGDKHVTLPLAEVAAMPQEQSTKKSWQFWK